MPQLTHKHGKGAGGSPPPLSPLPIRLTAALNGTQASIWYVLWLHSWHVAWDCHMHPGSVSMSPEFFRVRESSVERCVYSCTT